MDSETIEKVIQTCGSYQNQIPTQHWMLEDPLSDSLVMWAWWIDVSLGCLDKTNNMEMQYSKMQVGNKHTPQIHHSIQICGFQTWNCVLGPH